MNAFKQVYKLPIARVSMSHFGKHMRTTKIRTLLAG